MGGTLAGVAIVSGRGSVSLPQSLNAAERDHNLMKIVDVFVAHVFRRFQVVLHPAQNEIFGFVEDLFLFL